MLDAPDANKAPIVAALRAEMKARQLDAFILPRYDAHQAEYVAPHDERLAYVTGFTGSAGLAIITMDTVALFVDGRYVVQAVNQCPKPLFSHHHLFDDPPEDWLAGVAQPGWQVGFDPMHIPPTLFDRFAKAVQQGKLVTVEDNPVDRIWVNQPLPPVGEIEPFPVQISGQPTREKIDELVSWMRASGAELLVETQPDNIAWLLNIRGADVAFNPIPQSFVLVNANGSVLWFVAPSKLHPDVLQFLPETVQVRAPDEFLPAVKKQVEQGQSVLFDPAFSPVAVRATIEKAGGIAQPHSSFLTARKAVKNPVELQGMRSCHIQDGIAWVEFCAWLAAEVPRRSEAGQPVTEREAEEAILRFRQRQPGFLEQSFNSISAAGGNAAMCHYSTRGDNQVAIRPGDTYLLDSGGQYETGTTDATRSFAFGPKRPQGYDRAYTAVFQAFHSIATLRFPPGTQGHHIDAICRRPLWDLGLDYDHGTGHGVGHRLSVHEHPQRIGKPYNPVDLAPGMILSLEPGYYEQDSFGIRIENLVEIVEVDDGFLTFSNLTWCPIQTDMLLVEMLTDAEREWINAYNQRVVETLGSGLSSEALAWSKTACTPV
ncbi:aminopeptidase P family protein [Ruegeria sp. HKCCD4332]|uniref:aminopeptidase P family protein n=1 Tax=Ruegeria sp. HKCCD4332 TaxID=2683021 RepID=UPI0014931A97|nr:aminopeptidase P family protein [Ruegeria sp. HKCCD4332]NOD77723.1 M24 family metallopeptidase [Ruegeria sp. HKCCD4332]